MQIASRLICMPVWRNNKLLMVKQFNLNLKDMVLGYFSKTETQPSPEFSDTLSKDE